MRASTATRPIASRSCSTSKTPRSSPPTLSSAPSIPSTPTGATSPSSISPPGRFGLSSGLFALFTATFALTCLGISRLARSVWPDGGQIVGLLAVGLLLLARAGNIGTNHLFEPILLDRLIGFALGWCALALAIEGETWRPSALVGLAAVIHPSVGLQIGGLIGASWVAWSVAGRWTGLSWRASLIGLLTLAVAGVPGALPNLIQGRQLFEGLSPEEFRRIGVELQMAQHMVPSLWRRPQWLAWGGYVALARRSR